MTDVHSVVEKANKTFYKAIVFCSSPLKGHYRFEDKFQIYPVVSANAPKNDKIPYYPIILEYWVAHIKEPIMPDFLKDENGVVSKTTQSANYQKCILSLLSSISNYRFSFPYGKLQWFSEIPEGDLTKEMNTQKSKGGLNYYYYPEMYKENYITSFSEAKFPTIEKIKHPECFMSIDLENKEEVKFSEYIDIAINNYFALSDIEEKTVDAAASLIGNGIDLREQMRSLSYVSFISSIETMVNYEFKDEEMKKCATCGSEAYRVMGKFRDYLLKYASSNPNIKKRIEEIYKLRSKIAHAGLLLVGDNKIDWGNNEIQNEQWQTLLQVMQVSRLSLTNWLLVKGQ